MTLILVTHETEIPALDGMIAGQIAAERGAVLVTLVTGGAGLGRYDCTLHVLSHGELAANGLFWAEWASGRFVEPAMQAAAVAGHPAPLAVVSINPAIEAQKQAAARIAVHAETVERTVEHIRVEEDGDIFHVYAQDGGHPVASWMRDGFGRPCPAGTKRPASAREPVRILVVGDEALLRDTYPANLAALGDAADALGLDVALSFVDPREPDHASFDSLLSSVDGLVLPGGSDMEQVPGQIEAARASIRRDVPTVGLCLGMQTMATAVARELGGHNDANMAEADPDAQTKTFVRLHDEAGQPEFRLGLRRARVVSGTFLSEIFGGAGSVEVHCNHRYVLDPALHGPLARAGLTVSGLQEGRDLADAIEVLSLRFFVGMQGHPELLTRRDKPHPLIVAFLREAAAR